MKKDFWQAEYERIRFTKQWRSVAGYRAHVESVIGPRPDNASLKFSFRDGQVVLGTFHWEGVEMTSTPESTAPEAAQPEQASPTPTFPMLGNPWILTLLEQRHPGLPKARSLTRDIVAAMLPHMDSVVAMEELAGFAVMDRKMLDGKSSQHIPADWRDKRRAAYQTFVNALLQPVLDVYDNLPLEDAPPLEIPSLAVKTAAPATKPSATAPQPVMAPVPSPSVVVSAPQPQPKAPVAPLPQTALGRALVAAGAPVPTTNGKASVSLEYRAPKGLLFKLTDDTLADPWLPFLIEALLEKEGSKLLVVPTIKYREPDQLPLLLARIARLMSLPLPHLSVIHSDSITIPQVEAVPDIMASLFIGRSVPTRARTVVNAVTKGALSVTATEDSTMGSALRGLNQTLAERAHGSHGPNSLWARALRRTYQHRKGALAHTDSTIASLLNDMGVRPLAGARTSYRNLRLTNLQLVLEAEGMPQTEIDEQKSLLDAQLDAGMTSL